MLEPIIKTRLSDEAVKRIRKYIFEHGLQPGDKIPAERELSKYLQISRTSVREALRILEIIGMIEVRPGSGAYIHDSRGDQMATLSTWLPQTRETLREHFEIRQLLEPRAAGLAADRATADDIESLHELIEQFRLSHEKGDLAGMILADTEFHRRIAETTQNRTLTLLMNTITNYLYEGWKGILRLPGRSKESITEHQRIFEAIKAGNAQAATQAMYEHLSRATEDLDRAEF